MYKAESRIRRRNIRKRREKERGEPRGRRGSTLSTGSFPFSSEWTTFINGIVRGLDSQELLQSNI